MRINAYILAADPTWIETSVLAYYSVVRRIVVSYDSAHKGWTGKPIPVETCLRRLKAIDTESKMEFVPGEFHRADVAPMVNDTHQRQAAHNLASTDADWVMELDTDELLPDVDALLRIVKSIEDTEIAAVEWPMRVLFRRMGDGRYLEVASANGSDRFEYPGPIISRPGVTKCDARRVGERTLRVTVPGDRESLQLQRPPDANEIRLEAVSAADAIIHNSWARSAQSVRSKVASWSHNEGARSWFYYYGCWLPSPLLWRVMRDFHPFSRGLWPALKVCRHVPEGIPSEDDHESS